MKKNNNKSFWTKPGLSVCHSSFGWTTSRSSSSTVTTSSSSVPPPPPSVFSTTVRAPSDCTNKNIEEIATLFLIQCFLRIKILGKLINQYKKKQVLVFFSLVFQFVRRNSCRSYLLAVNADNMRAKQHRGRKQEETSEGKSSGWDASHRHGNGEQQARSQESEQLNIPK